MLSLREKSVISLPYRAASMGASSPQSRSSFSWPKSCFKMSSTALLLRLFGIFFPLLLLERRASVLFRQPIFQQNQILDSLNCGAHSGALRPSRISKTYLSIMPCLSRGEICPRPIDEAVSAAISTSVRFSGPRDWRYSWIRV